MTNASDLGRVDWDFVVIGSGFGGSVSALRLAEKGYRVLVLEKGRRFEDKDFPRTNWDLKNWFWMPRLGMRGFFQMTFFRHLTVLHGVGVGGGSLVYGNTLPVPPDAFFAASSWSDLADWREELAPHYRTAQRMLGATTNPVLFEGDRILQKIAQKRKQASSFGPTEVGVFFGTPGQKVADPYFAGDGPERSGCTFCGACMTGCRIGAKNTLQKNYLHLAERLGVQISPGSEATHVAAIKNGYRIEIKTTAGTKTVQATNVIFAGGVLGTVPLLLRMREDSTGLPNLSARIGEKVRTNNEALLGVIGSDERFDRSQGVAITSIFHPDKASSIEPVRYGSGSDFFRLLAAPYAPASFLLKRLWLALLAFWKAPRRWFQALRKRDFAKRTQILLYMRTEETTLNLRLGRGLFSLGKTGLVSSVPANAKPPSTHLPDAAALADEFAEQSDGVVMTLVSETLLGTPSTAHILGGACMAANADEGVIDHRHRVFGYPGLYVIDGSAVSANPGVNPSLTITALAERAMTFIPRREPSSPPATPND